MFHLVKLLFYTFRELIFTDKEEYDIKSKKFNARKMIVLILITGSFVLNVWLIYRFVYVANELLICREAVREIKPPATIPIDESTAVSLSAKAKKPVVDSSDSEESLKPKPK